MLRKGLLWLVVFVLAIGLVNALMASIDKPKMVLYKNVTSEEPLVFTQSVIVNNNNDFDVEIELEPSGDFKDIAELEETKFTMGSDERKEVFYEITITKPGTYQGEIIVKFTDTTENVGAALAQIVTVLVKGEGDFEEELVEEEPELTSEEVIVETEEPEPETEEEQVEVIEEPSIETTTVEQEGKPSVLIGILVIIGILLAGVLVYSLIFMRGAKK